MGARRSSRLTRAMLRKRADSSKQDSPRSWRAVSKLASFERRQHIRIAHVHPATFDFQTGDALPGINHRADGIRQFVFATRRFIEPGREAEQDRAKYVDAGIIPDG